MRYQIWVPLRYEKLSRTYFKCGFIAHGVRGCNNTLANTSLNNGGKSQYGSWLRADSLRRRKNAKRADSIDEGKSGTINGSCKCRKGNRVKF